MIEAMLQSPAFLFWMEQTPNPKWKPYAGPRASPISCGTPTPDDALLDQRGARRAEHAGRSRTGSSGGCSRSQGQGRRGRIRLPMAAIRSRAGVLPRAAAVSAVQPRTGAVDDGGGRALSAIWSGTIEISWMSSPRTTASSTRIWRRSTRCLRRRATFDRVEFPPDSERAGLLGQALFLTLSSKPDETAPTGRGLFVREQFLCQQVPPPPAGRGYEPASDRRVASR